MSLVSSLYAMGPSPAHTPEERRDRNLWAIRRLLGAHGPTVVLSRLLEAPPDDVRDNLLRLTEVESARSWLGRAS